MIIEVKQPTFVLDKNNYKNVSYNKTTGIDWKSIMVQTYPHGFPKLKHGEVLYKYKKNRGYITNYITYNTVFKEGDIEYEYTKLGKNNLVGIYYSGEGDVVLEINKFLTNKFGDDKYTEFIDMNMDNPWVRIIVIGEDNTFLFRPIS